MSPILGPVPEVTRRRACRILGHEDPGALGLNGCAMPDEDLVERLCDLVEQLRTLAAVRDLDREFP